jgi:hypothetical protein
MRRTQRHTWFALKRVRFKCMQHDTRLRRRALPRRTKAISYERVPNIYCRKNVCSYRCGQGEKAMFCAILFLSKVPPAFRGGCGVVLEEGFWPGYNLFALAFMRGYRLMISRRCLCG